MHAAEPVMGIMHAPEPTMGTLQATATTAMHATEPFMGTRHATEPTMGTMQQQQSTGLNRLMMQAASVTPHKLRAVHASGVELPAAPCDAPATGGSGGTKCYRPALFDDDDVTATTTTAINQRNDNDISAHACVSGLPGPGVSPRLSDDGADTESVECLPWWPEAVPVIGPDGNIVTTTTPTDTETYHSKAHLEDPDEEALLVDTGAFGSLSGDKWAERQHRLAVAAGCNPVYSPMPKPINVHGVGKTPQLVKDQVLMPGQLENGNTIHYKTPLVPNSEIPALFGITSMEQNDVIIDTRKCERKMYFGKTTTITPGPDTQTLQLYPAQSGHLMLPISRFKRRTQTATQHAMALVSTPASSSDEPPPLE